MQRFAIALVALGSLGIAPAASGLANGSATPTDTAVQGLLSDFNNDGFADLAVGVPGETVGSLVNAGMVNVLYGGAAGLSGSGSQTFTQDSPGVGSTAEEFDIFGEALAAGDFNSDGFADLAVGAAGESSGIAAIGAVHVLYGGVGGLSGSGSQFFTQDSPGVGSTAEEADFFGDSLSTRDFNNDGFADLAVGAPGESVGSLGNAGMVHVLYGGGAGISGSGSGTFTQDSPGVGSTAEVADFLGNALTTGDFNNDGFADLAAGAPGESVGSLGDAGMVNVLYGGAAGISGSGSQAFTQDSTGVGSTAEELDMFGNALAADDFDNDGFADLAVGAPGESGSVPTIGMVNVLYGGAAGLTGSGSATFTQDSPGVGSTAEADDSFGAAVAAADFNNDGFADLAVGAPGESGSVPAIGMVNVLNGGATGLTGSGSATFTQNSPGVGSTPEVDDSFGLAVATADFNNDGFADLAVGAPGESSSLPAVGMVNVLYSGAGGLTGSGSATFTQDSPGVGSTAEEFDLFGFALAASVPDGPIAAAPAAVTASSAARSSHLLQEGLPTR